MFNVLIYISVLMSNFNMLGSDFNLVFYTYEFCVDFRISESENKYTGKNIDFLISNFL